MSKPRALDGLDTDAPTSSPASPAPQTAPTSPSPVTARAPEPVAPVADASVTPAATAATTEAAAEPAGPTVPQSLYELAERLQSGETFAELPDFGGAPLPAGVRHVVAHSPTQVLAIRYEVCDRTTYLQRNAPSAS
jgi:hypothetical protein